MLLRLIVNRERGASYAQSEEEEEEEDGEEARMSSVAPPRRRRRCDLTPHDKQRQAPAHARALVRVDRRRRAAPRGSGAR